MNWVMEVAKRGNDQHFKLLLEMSFFPDYDVEGNYLQRWLDKKKKKIFPVNI